MGSSRYESVEANEITPVDVNSLTYRSCKKSAIYNFSFTSWHCGENEEDLLFHLGRRLSCEAAILIPRGKVLESGTYPDSFVD
jgi:hypothetical protein